MELPSEKRVHVIEQLKRLDGTVQRGILPELRYGAAMSVLELTQLLITLFGREETDRLLVEAGVNHGR